MFVSKSEIDQVIEEILQHDFISIDTETTGLRPFHGDEPFSIIIATKDKEYYFNLNSYPGVDPLPSTELAKLSRVFESNIEKVFHNSQFDLHQLLTINLPVFKNLYDLWFLARIENNTHFDYSLEQIAKRRGFSKIDTPKKYVKENGLIEKFEDKRLNKHWDCLHYELVPLEIMQPYAEADARLTFDIAKDILEKLKLSDSLRAKNWPEQMSVVRNESRLIETINNMEQLGVKIDKKYCEEAVTFYSYLLKTCEESFKKLTGEDFVKGETVFLKVFKDEEFKFTEKGNPIFDANAMAGFKHPAAKIVLDYSEAKKQLEYFQNFLFFADENDTVHASFLQAGTTTGRFSSRSPNLQNLTNPDKYEEEAEGSKFPVRKAFVPRDGFFFAMLDYSQIEYRVMLDRAGAKSLISQINDLGLDVHQATANIAGVSRKDAKTVNFLTLYGGGIKKLAGDLGCTMKKARDIQGSIFSAAPEISSFISSVIDKAKERGFIFNWLGRPCRFPDSEFAYKAPNHLIQGDCADILKVAMNRIDEFLKDYKSRMILTIHDELIFEVSYGEEFIIPEIKKTMEGVYPYQSLPLLVDVECSTKNLADKEPWPPQHLESEQAAGVPFKRESSCEIQATS